MNRSTEQKPVQEAPRHSERFRHQISPSGQIRFSKRVLIAGSTGLAALLLGIGLTTFANSKANDEVSEHIRVLTVNTIDLEPVTSFQTQREYTGTIVANRASDLGFELSGRIERVYKEEGDIILEGTPLASLDTDRLDTQRLQLVARKEQAAAKLEEMLNGPRSEDIAASRARVDSLQAQVKLIRLQTDRQKKLISSRATSHDEYEQRKFGLQSLEADHQQAKHDLAELLNGTRKEQIRAQRAVVSELEATLSEIDVDLRKSTLIAPFGGTLASRRADEGTVVEPNRPVFRLIEDQVLEAWIGLPVHASHQLADQSTRTVTIDGHHYTATLKAIFPEVDPSTRTRTIVFSLEHSAVARVVHGQVVRLGLEETVASTGYWIPSTALTKASRGLWTALVAAPVQPTVPNQTNLFSVERRAIEVLHAESDRVLVRGSLRTGDRVISNGIHRVVPDQLVRIAQ